MLKRELEERYFGFPESLNYKEFLELPDYLREQIVCRNRILQTDTYNRTMDKAKGEDWKNEETYILQLRKSPHNYLITTGIPRQLHKIFSLPISQTELDFAVEFYARANVKHFNREKWDWVIKEHQGILPIKIDGLPEGTAVLPGDPVLRITGPGELAAHFEPDWHRIFYPTLVATTAHEISQLIGKNRFIEAGMRGGITEETHLIGASAMYIGGGLFLTSDDAAAACYSELKDSGTLAHRFLAYKQTEREAIIQALTSPLEKIAPVVDLNNTLTGIETVLEIKKEYRYLNKPIWMRMDSGNVAQLAIHALKRQSEMGFSDPVLDKVAISDVDSLEEMVEIDSKIRAAGFDPQQFIVYVAGELLMGKDKTRNIASTGFKLSRHLERSTMKHSDSLGKGSYPGDITLNNFDHQRIIAQSEEYPSGDLFVPLWRPEKGIVAKRMSLTASRDWAEESYTQIAGRTKERSIISPKTQQMISDYERKVVNCS